MPQIRAQSKRLYVCARVIAFRASVRRAAGVSLEWCLLCLVRRRRHRRFTCARLFMCVCVCSGRARHLYYTAHRTRRTRTNHSARHARKTRVDRTNAQSPAKTAQLVRNRTHAQPVSDLPQYVALHHSPHVPPRRTGWLFSTASRLFVRLLSHCCDTSKRNVKLALKRISHLTASSPLHHHRRRLSPTLAINRLHTK